MKGKKYDNQSVRLLFVGRAVNGWGKLNTSSADDFAAEAAEQIQGSNFGWIICDHGALRNDYLDNGDYYWLSNSPFWRTNKRIWMNLTDNHDFKDCEHDRWVDYIAWTNLFKIAPPITGNPTSAMVKHQLTACKKILRAEIESFKPTHILFVTGYEWWFESFKDIFDIEFSNIKKNVYRGPDKNSFFAEATGTTPEGIRIVVSCRPEFRDESLYVEDVTKSFD